MKSKTSSPAVQKAYAYVKANLEKQVWRPGEYLPPVRRLAIDAGVSFSSMIRAVARLKSADLVSTLERGRIRAGEAFVAERPIRENEQPIWLMKRAALEKDVLEGVYSAQEILPSCKELQARYGICFSTLRKILRSMITDGALRLNGKVYQLRNEQRRQVGQRIVFITNQTVPISALNQGQYRVLDELERECIRRGLKLEIVLIDFYDRTATSHALAGGIINKPALGIVVDLWWQSSDIFRRSVIDLFTHLSELNSPVAILDENSNFDLPIQLASNPRMQVFGIEDKQAGARVARMLLGMGHSSVVYVSFAHNVLWSTRRLLGIREEFAKAGYGKGVHAAVADSFESPLELVLATSGWDDNLVRRILTADRTPSQVEDAYANYRRFKESRPVRAFDPAVVKLVTQSLVGIDDLVARDANKGLLDAVIPPALQKAGAHLAEYSIRPLLEEALRFHNATAWICASDAMAFMTLSFLESRSISVPKDLSIVGFDNTPGTTLKQRLTSFDFNASGFVHCMLNFIARPPRPRGPYRHSPIEVEGIVMLRDTVRPPRRSAIPATNRLYP